MEMFNMQIKNADPVLVSLLNTLQNSELSENVYLSRLKSGESKKLDHSVVRPNMLGVPEQILPVFLQILGIRSLTLKESFDLGPLFALDFSVPDQQSGEVLWHSIRNEEVVRELRLLFQNCSTIAFDDWANIAGASDLWDGLLSEVIKPIHRTDLEFIFYFGDSTEKRSFQVDMALDLIGTFSNRGKVTLALDESEAIKLWMILNGIQADTAEAQQASVNLKKKYFSIFRTVNIAQLLIYSSNTALLFSNDEQFAISRKSVDYSAEISKDARQNFIEGFSMGLLMGMDAVHSLALGLCVFGAYAEPEYTADKPFLITYIQKWMADLDKSDDIYLYQ